MRVPLPDDPLAYLAVVFQAMMRKRPIPTFLTYYGTGIVLGDGLVLTANHVVNEKIRLSLIGVTNDGRKFGCKVLTQDADRDLALLYCAGVNKLGGVHSFAPLSLPLGSRVLTAGYAGGRGLIFTDGILASRELDKGKMLVSAMSGPGMSGGAVFTYDGSLVGVIQAGYMQPPFTMISTNSLQLQRFLRKVAHEHTRRDGNFEVQHPAHTAASARRQIYPCISGWTDECGGELSR